ncbi:hypothetical protein [Pasteurella multocida]|uniref:hypothetical protein n=1 Tax=Pasteurella multocida TaxID=747 RepID=UPI00286E8B52|nr:hypothetical protein [Pasteurella multocida]
MKYFDTKKSLPVLCSLLITACSGGGGGNNNVPHPPVEKRTVVTPQTQKVTEKQIPSADTAKYLEPQKEAPLEKVPMNNVDSIPSVTPVQKDSQWYGRRQGEYGSHVWNHHPEKVPVFDIIPNENHIYVDDKNFDVKPVDVDLTRGPYYGDFHFQLDDGYEDTRVYSGYYLSSDDNMRTKANYVFAFDKTKEYTEKNITAKFYNEKGFHYSVRDDRYNFIQQVGTVNMVYKDGSVSGEITTLVGRKPLFNFKNSSDKDPNEIMVSPHKNNPHGLVSHGPDDMFMNVHFINGENGEQHKYVVGSGRGERFYGTLFATQKEE